MHGGLLGRPGGTPGKRRQTGKVTLAARWLQSRQPPVAQPPSRQWRETESPWTCSSTRRGTCSPLTAFRCWTARLPRRRRRPEPPPSGSAAAGWSSRHRSRPAAAARPAASSSPTTPPTREAKAAQILGMDIKGHTVHRVMLAPAADIAEEYYFSILLDRANRTFLAMASREGGVEIETLAVEKPEALARVPIDALTGIDDAKAREIADEGRLPRRDRRPGGRGRARALGRLREGGRDAGRGQPAGEDRRRARHRPRRQGDPRRERRLPPARSTPRCTTSTPTTRWRPRRRRRASTTSSSTARSASSATAPAS